MNDKVTREQTKKMAAFAVRRYNEGASLKQIAAETGTTERSVRRYLNMGGIKLNVGRRPKVLDEQLEGMYEKVRLKQTSYIILASELGVSVNTIRARIKDYERSKRAKRNRPDDK